MSQTQKARVIRIEQPGGPEVMKLVEVDLGPPGPGQVQVRHSAIGLNYIDVYFRTGLYPQPMPAGIGMEGAGVVTAVGEGIKRVKVGDRVAYSGNPTGAYADIRNMPENNLVKLPKNIDFDSAAAMMLKGLTVQYLFRRTYKLQKGQTILFHAAAGGVGLIAMQWAKALGVSVIGTVGSKEKGDLARAHGCDHIIYYNKENVAERVREITKGGDGAGGVRLGRQGHLAVFAGQPAALWPDGQLWQCLRSGATVCTDRLEKQPLRDPAFADGPHGQSRQPRRDGGRPVQARGFRQNQDQD